MTVVISAAQLAQRILVQRIILDRKQNPFAVNFGARASQLRESRIQKASNLLILWIVSPNAHIGSRHKLG
jgi:hypothetical protein